jgi:hypothetical protein
MRQARRDSLRQVGEPRSEHFFLHEAIEGKRESGNQSKQKSIFNQGLASLSGMKTRLFHRAPKT